MNPQKTELEHFIRDDSRQDATDLANNTEGMADTVQLAPDGLPVKSALRSFLESNARGVIEDVPRIITPPEDFGASKYDSEIKYVTQLEHLDAIRAQGKASEQKFLLGVLSISFSVLLAIILMLRYFKGLRGQRVFHGQEQVRHNNHNSPLMTVGKYNYLTRKVECSWFDANGNFHSEWINQDELKRYDEIPSIEG
jgi:hypothetical protein